jgi:hypothetical protein
MHSPARPFNGGDARLRVRFNGGDAFTDRQEPVPTEERSQTKMRRRGWQATDLVAQLLGLVAFGWFGSTLSSFLCLCGLTHRRSM